MFFSKTPQPINPPSPPPPPSWADAVRKALAEELGESSRGPDDLLYFPGSPEFADSETGFHTAQANEVRSAAVARPTSTAEVSALVKALRRSLLPSMPLAVRGGGHATYAGAAKAAGGVTIDTRGVRGIEILKGAVVVVAVRACASRRATAGATCARPAAHDGGRARGAGGRRGFLLGGGVSFFSYQHGFGADLVTAWEVVLASGRVVCATAPSSEGKDGKNGSGADEDTEDLWDALRGGSTNFGIVTAVEMECFPHPKHFRCAYMFYLTPARQSTLEALVKGQAEPVVDHVIWSISHVPYVPVKILAVSSSSTGAAGQDGLSELVTPWSRIPGTATPREVKHSAYAKEVGDFACKDGSRNAYKAISVKLDLDLLNTIVDMWYDLIRATRHRAGYMNTLAFLPRPGLYDRSVLRPAEWCSRNQSRRQLLRPPPRRRALVIVEICHNWHSAADDPAAFGAVDDFLRDVDRVATERGPGMPLGLHQLRAARREGDSGLRRRKALPIEACSIALGSRRFLSETCGRGFKIEES
ncbi:hypothetical protein PG997_006421 [Apiospora hydei]|uniref:FAD-binding PCMH-type domain-containing protein n=1 Tax=Apiospora hydei TaxID=1337664 RepID=A0ABR1WNP3_9PEZI